MGDKEEKLGMALSLARELSEYISGEKGKLPFQINLLDQVWPNENAHSRILLHFFQYHKEGSYLLFELFLKALGSPFKNLRFDNPIFSSETDRIDLRIRDQNKTLIIENKIHYAQDQPRQIERYIQKELKKGYSWKNIYVLYLAREKSFPSTASLSEQTKQKLKENFQTICFREEVVDWLKKSLALLSKRNDEKEELLKSALLQYKNHIEGLFYLRKGEREMQDTIRQFVYREVGIEKDASLKKKACLLFRAYQNASTLSYELESYLQEILIEAIKQFLKQLKAIIEKDLGLETECLGPEFGWKHSKVCFKKPSWKTSIRLCVGFDRDPLATERNFYCGVWDKEKKIEESKRQKLRENLPNPIHSPPWPYYSYVDFASVPELIETFQDEVFLGDIKTRIDEMLQAVESLDLTFM